jgi:hypothetical protein
MALQNDLAYQKREAAGPVALSDGLPELRLALHARNALQAHRRNAEQVNELSCLR